MNTKNRSRVADQKLEQSQLTLVAKPKSFCLKTFCAVYGVGRTKAYELISAGEIATVKIGRSRRVIAKSAKAWFRRRQLEAGK